MSGPLVLGFVAGVAVTVPATRLWHQRTTAAADTLHYRAVRRATFDPDALHQQAAEERCRAAHYRRLWRSAVADMRAQAGLIVQSRRRPIALPAGPWQPYGKDRP